MDTGSFSTCLYFGVLVLILVVGVPLVDTFFCRRLSLNPVGGKNRTLGSNRAYVLRRICLFLGFAVYLAGFLYVTFFSREAADDYLVHCDLFKNFVDSVIDFGILGYIINEISNGAVILPSDLPELDFSGITQVILNIILFIPMGYLLPYLFAWFRKGVKLKVTVASFLISLTVENVQLVTKLGYYDLDDLVTNTLGGFFGGLLFLTFAFWVTHPDWRKVRKEYRRWKRNARKRTLYPFAKDMTLSRTFLRATDETVIQDFYVTKLGFRVIGKLVPEDRDGAVYLLELGSYQVEILCANEDEELEPQNLIISVKKPDKVRKRLEKNGLAVTPYAQDPFTGLNSFMFDAPDNVKVIILAQDE